MGNVDTHDLPPVRDDERKELNLSRKINQKLYEQHVGGSQLEGALTELPWTIVDSISLYERMDVSFNSLTKLPVELPLRLPHLAHLNLSHNQLSELPDSFPLLFHLTSLNLSYNKIESLPKTFTHLVKLYKLDLSHNSLQSLPEDLGAMESLEKLNVSNNQLLGLPPSLGRSPVLRVLLAICNNCQFPPQSVCEQGSEKTLKFMQVKIANGDVPKIKTIKNVFKRVRGNQLQSSVANPHSARAQYVQSQTHTANTTSRIRTPLRPPIRSTSLDVDELSDKIIGMIYGAAIGDALGLCTTYLSVDQCNFHYDKDSLCYDQMIVDSYRSNWTKGDWTTHFSQMILVMDSVLQWAGVVDELDFAQRLYHWCLDAFPEVGEKTGIVTCNTITKVIEDSQFRQDPHSAARRHWDRLQQQLGPAGSVPPDQCLTDPTGAMARSLILGIVHFHNLKEVAINSRRICLATHYDERCVTTCVVISSLVALILQGKYEEILNAQSTENIIRHVLQQAPLTNSHDYKETDIIKFVVNALSVPLLALTSQNNFRKVMAELVMKGGESSCKGCIAGALLGCKLGYRNLPGDLIEGLKTLKKEWLNVKINAFLDMMALP